MAQALYITEAISKRHLLNSAVYRVLLVAPEEVLAELQKGTRAFIRRLQRLLPELRQWPSKFDISETELGHFNLLTKIHKDRVDSLSLGFPAQGVCAMPQQSGWKLYRKGVSKYNKFNCDARYEDTMI